MARTYGKAQDLIDFTRASSGTALRRVKYGAELVTNGTFDTDLAGWTGAGWVWSDGKAYDSGASVTEGLSQSIATVAGKLYAFQYDITGISGGTPSSRIGGAIVKTHSADETGVQIFFTATSSSTTIDVVGGNATFYLDNISVKEVTFDTLDGDLVLFNHPNNIPRIEYDANGNVLGLLVEESRSNILPYSQAFDAVDWFKTRGDVASESISDPFGGQGAFSWTANEFAETYIADGATISSGATITFSAFIKKKTADHCHLLVWDNSANGCRVWFDLVNGQVGTDTSFGSTFVVAGSSITESANGWYRCSMTVTTSGSTTAVVRLHPSNGNGDINSSVGKSIYIYGAQLEVGSFPTSYIPTSGSTVTRSADVASLSTSAFGYNGNEATFFVEYDRQYTEPSGGTYPKIIQVTDGTGNNRFHAQGAPSSANMNIATYNSGSSTSLTPASVFASSHKIAISIDSESSFKFVIDGTISGSIATNIVDLSLLTDVEIGLNLLGPSQQLNGHIKSLKYIPRELIDSQLEALTA